MRRVKNTKLYYILLATLVLISACGGGPNNNNKAQDTELNYQISFTSTMPDRSSEYDGHGSYSLEKTDTYLKFTTRDTMLASFEPTTYLSAVYANIDNVNPVIRLPLVLNDTWSAPGEYTDPAWTVSSSVTSLSDTVSIGSGVYNNCAKVTTNISGSGISNGQVVSTAPEDDFVDGTRDVWFAPGVGIVKIVYSHNDGTTTTVELQSYSIAEPGTDYFPLAVGNTWTYKWINEYRSSYVIEVYTVDRTCNGICDLPKN